MNAGNSSDARTELSTSDVVANTARNLAAMFDHVASSMGKRVARWDALWAADGSGSHPFQNSATLLQPLVAGAAGGLLERLDRFYGEAGGGPWHLGSVWPTPDLAPFGYNLYGHAPLMVRLPGATVPPAPPELHLVEVTDGTTLAAYESVLIDGFPLPELQPVTVGSMFDPGVLGQRYRLWVGYVGDQPVSCASAYLDSGVVGVYFVATRPEARRHGYGAAVTARAAQVDPALPAVLQASELGRPMYERVGFTTVSNFTIWQKER